MSVAEKTSGVLPKFASYRRGISVPGATTEDILIGCWGGGATKLGIERPGDMAQHGTRNYLMNFEDAPPDHRR